MKTTILVHCPDQSGIISTVTGFIHRNHGNIVYLDQHVDKPADVFFMRIVIEFTDTFSNLDHFKSLFQDELASPYTMEWSLHTDDKLPKMAIFVSKYNHCLYDLLSRYRSGELAVEIPFFYIPFNKQNRVEAEKEQLALLEKYEIDFIVLARYMQIVSGNLISKFPNRIINIHHSFLPAFAGAKPYHAAFKRGVKIIGATSHYVTEELDEGPIIEQDVTTVTHSHSIEDFITKGRDLEKIVLSRGVKLHIARKTMVYNNKTVIFS